MKLTASDKGALVAVANLVTVAACVAVMVESGRPVDWHLTESLPSGGYILGLLVADMALLPALLVGVHVGKLAGSLTGTPAQRFGVLAAASVGAITLFGALVGWVQLIPLAALPTLAWTWHLERWTRHAEALPAARTA